MAKTVRPGLRLIDRLILLVAWIATCGVVYLMGFYLGKGTQEGRLKLEERVVRLPVTSAPPPEGQRPNRSGDLSFYEQLLSGGRSGSEGGAPAPKAPPSAAGGPGVAAPPPAHPGAVPAPPPALPAAPGASAGTPAPAAVPAPAVAPAGAPAPAAAKAVVPPVPPPAGAKAVAPPAAPVAARPAVAAPSVVAVPARPVPPPAAPASTPAKPAPPPTAAVAPLASAPIAPASPPAPPGGAGQLPAEHAAPLPTWPPPARPAPVASPPVATAMPPPPPAPRAGSWTVEANPTRDRAEAEVLQKRLRTRGYDSTLVRVLRDGETWYRLHVGSYGSQEQAAEVMRKLRDSEGVAHAFVASE